MLSRSAELIGSERRTRGQEKDCLVMEDRTMAKQKKRESLVVASKVKTYIRDKKMMTASDCLDALNDRLYQILDCAIARAKANKRATVRPQDI